MPPFEEQLSNRLKQLPSKPMSDETIAEVINKLEHDNGRNHRPELRGRWGVTAAAVAAVVIVGIVLGNLDVLPPRSESAHPNFPIVESPLAMRPTPLDTTSFQNTLRDYLERHDLATEHSSTIVAVSNEAAKQTLPVINKISELAVRWSQLVDDKYGAATVTYVGNGKPRISNVLVLKSGPDTWSVEQVNNLPATVTPTALSHFSVYPGEWGGTGFRNPVYGDDQVQFRFLSGLVIDPSITRVEAVRNNGSVVNVPIINGTYGYLQVAPPGTNFYNGTYKLRGYNKWGVLIFQH